MGKALLLALNILGALYGVYFVGVIVLGALRRRRSAYPDVAPSKRIAAIIAARNEEVVIGATVKTLLEQAYPGALFDVWVVPNNCTDNTEKIAREAGAEILECTVPVTSKGDVLRFAFDKLLAMDAYDAFCIFDADNLVEQNFLKVANNALCAGEKVAQGFRDSKNSRESWVAGGMSVFYWFMSRFFNEGRSALGMSAMLNGTGVMISAELLKQTGWDTFTLTEDLEYTAQCGLMGVKIAFMKDAVTYDEQPNGFWLSFEQRRRWFRGGMQCMWRYSPRLWARAFRTRSLQAFDFAVFFMGNVMQVVCLIPGIAAFFSAARYILLHEKMWLLLAGVAVVGILLILVISAAAAILCKMVGRRAREELPGIFGFWIIAITWVPANLSAIIFPPKWKPIPHSSRARLFDLTECDRRKRSTTSEEASGF